MTPCLALMTPWALFLTTTRSDAAVIVIHAFSHHSNAQTKTQDKVFHRRDAVRRMLRLD